MSKEPKPLTQKAKLAIARAIIDKYAIDEPFTAEDLKVLSDITGTELSEAYRRRNPEFPNDTRHLHVLAFDWHEPQQWSWRKAIKYGPKPGPEAEARRALQKRLLALRQSIRGDLRDFKESADPYCCALCAATMDLTVDHIKPPFHFIAMEFIKLHGNFALKEIQGMSDGFADDDL